VIGNSLRRNKAVPKIFLPLKTSLLILISLTLGACRPPELKNPCDPDSVSPVERLFSEQWRTSSDTNNQLLPLLVPNRIFECPLIPRPNSGSANASNLNSQDSSNIPPRDLAYNPSTLNLSWGNPLTAVRPSITGKATLFSVQPNLPQGLSLNSSNGEISGTPGLGQSLQSYTISAQSDLGSTTTSIQIAVANPNSVISVPTQVLRTGETTSLVTGDDGFYQRGVARNLIIGGTEGLLWQRCNAGESFTTTCTGTPSQLTWSQAVSYCSNLQLAGRTWRLPKMSELIKLQNFSVATEPLIDASIFPNTQSGSTDWYWTSESYPIIADTAWMFSFHNGAIGYNPKTFTHYFRCVSGSENPDPSFVDNANGTVRETNTDLLWQKCGSGQTPPSCTGASGTFTWTGAIAYCESLTLAGKSDWRLPNKNELRTIFDFKATSTPHLSPSFFPNSPSDPFWSSTSRASPNTDAWSVWFDNGSFPLLGKSSPNHVFCVTNP